MAVWLCGYVAMLLYGYMAMWLGGCVAMWLRYTFHYVILSEYYVRLVGIYFFCLLMRETRVVMCTWGTCTWLCAIWSYIYIFPQVKNCYKVTCYIRLRFYTFDYSDVSDKMQTLWPQYWYDQILLDQPWYDHDMTNMTMIWPIWPWYMIIIWSNTYFACK